MAPESLSEQLRGAPVGTAVDTIQMRLATICLMADRYKAEGRDGGQRDEEGGRQPEGQMMAEKGKKGRCNIHFSLQVSVIGQMKVFGKRFCHFGLNVTSRVTLQSSHSDTVAELHPGELTC